MTARLPRSRSRPVHDPAPWSAGGSSSASLPGHCCCWAGRSSGRWLIGVVLSVRERRCTARRRQGAVPTRARRAHSPGRPLAGTGAARPDAVVEGRCSPPRAAARVIIGSGRRGCRPLADAVQKERTRDRRPDREPRPPAPTATCWSWPRPCAPSPSGRARTTAGRRSTSCRDRHQPRPGRHVGQPDRAARARFTTEASTDEVARAPTGCSTTSAPGRAWMPRSTTSVYVTGDVSSDGRWPGWGRRVSAELGVVERARPSGSPCSTSPVPSRP